MARWINDSTNKDTFASLDADGKLRGKVNHIIAGEIVFADRISSNTLRLTKDTQKAKAGQYFYRTGFEEIFTSPQLPSNPPPPSSEAPIAYLVGHDSLGNIVAYFDRRS